MPAPPPSPGVQVATLFVEEKRSPTNNELTVYALGLPALRRVRVAFRVSNRTNQVTKPAPWWVSVRSKLAFPLRDLAPLGTEYTEMWSAPSMVPIPPLGAPLMSILELFLPALPQVASVTFRFSAQLNDPATDSEVWGYPDSTPHNYDGLFLLPYGSGVFLRREVGDDGNDDRFSSKIQGAAIAAAQKGKPPPNADPIEVGFRMPNGAYRL